MSIRRSFLVATLACAAGAAFAQTAAPVTSAWPSKPIRLIVGYASGSSPDVQARLLAEPLSSALGQPVLVGAVRLATRVRTPWRNASPGMQPPTAA